MNKAADGVVKGRIHALQIRLHGKERAEAVDGGICHSGGHDGVQCGQRRSGGHDGVQCGQRRSGSALPQRCAAGERTLGAEPAQRRAKQQHGTVIHQIAVEHPGHLAVNDGHDDHDGEVAVDYVGGGAAAVQAAAERGEQRQRQHPQVRRGGQNAARELLADRADDGVRLDVGLPQERENTLPAGQLEQTREHSRADAHGVEAALGHIVAGQVVVGAKVKGRAEPCSVVPHEPGSDQHHRQQERGGLPCPGAAAQPLLPDVPRPEDGHGQKRKQLHLGAAPGDERHAEAAEDELDDQRTALFHRRAGGGEPEPKPQHQQRRTAEDGIFINVGAQQQIVELTAQRYGGHGQ